MFSMPIALTVHAPFFEENKITPLIVKTASLVDQICCVSKWVMSEMKEHVPQYTHKLRLIYNGISLPEMIPSPLIFSPPTLLLLGRFSSEKGFQTAIEAFFVLKKNHSDARLLIIGEGSERINLENLVNQLNLKNAVTFIGRLDKKEIPIYINQATIAIVPSYLESFGLAALEAMQMGRPVIASEVGGLPEIVSHKKTGLLVPPQDPIALCKAIESLLEQPEKTVQMGMNAREYASTHFTLNENVSQYENLYKNLKNKEPT
jgi:glycosyltransferase involved in cell wall biosynthesis